MATAALLGTSCSQFCHNYFHATLSEGFVPSGSVISASHSFWTVLNPPHSAPCRNHNECRKFLFRRLQFCGERISHFPRLPNRLSCHSCSPARVDLRGDACLSRRHDLGSNLREYDSEFSSRGMMTSPRGTDTGPSVVCRGAAAGVAEIVTFKPFLDKLMLLGTVMYYFITGVSAVPGLPELASGGKRVSSATPKASAPTQKYVKKPVQQQQQQQQQKARQQVSNEDTWLALESKLSKALSLEDSEVEEQRLTNPVLSLQAFARGPRQHLLYTTLHRLRKEIASIAKADQDLSMSQWCDLSLGVLCRTVLPVCRNWVSQDFTAMNLQPVNAAKDFQIAGNTTGAAGAENISLTQSQVLDNMAELLKETQSIRIYLTKSGKAELYSDLIFFLRFGLIRMGGCCDYRSFTRFAGKSLEDMVVVVAEVVATLFLDSCSSVATLSPQSETWQTFLLPSILSTRSLERFRNEVALNGWLTQNFTSVVAMFEDRFDLWTFQRRPLSNADKKPVKSGKFENGEKKVESHEMVLTRVELPARRSDELKALTGWRYYYSLYLEFSDVVGPILGMLVTRLGEAVSFLLVRLIGRSLGLVYQGIRQSVRWSPHPNRPE